MRAQSTKKWEQSHLLTLFDGCGRCGRLQKSRRRRSGGLAVASVADRMKSRLSSHDNENALAPLYTAEQTGIGGTDGRTDEQTET